MKLLNEAKLRDIHSLISNGNKLNFNVNFYQRPYRWPAKKVTELFEDYKENRESASKKGKKQEYFIGAVVLVEEKTRDDNDDNNKEWNYQIVDGQQRFTTLFLFNYIKYMLLVRKVDAAAKTKNAMDFIEGVNSLLDCYRGFIGDKNDSTIESANNELSEAFNNACRAGSSIENNVLDKWREAVGWISNPIISNKDYYEKCCAAMANFLKNEQMRIHYQNKDFNEKFKNALSKIVFKYSDENDPSICEEILDYEYDNESDQNIEFPYVDRAYGIFKQINDMDTDISDNKETPYEKLCRYIGNIDEMLSNIKMCMIVTSDEDDAYKLFETLNDRSESVNDLELLKNYFFKTYTETSGEDKNIVYDNLLKLDSRWRNIFFTFADLRNEIFTYLSVLFAANTDNKNKEERKRKLIKKYLSKYNDSNNRYTYEKVDQDFKFMEYVQVILTNTRKVDPSTLTVTEDAQLSLYIENDPGSSIVKRALGLALNLNYTLIAGSLICDIIHNYNCNGSNYPEFKGYLNCVFNEIDCKKTFPGLWGDACVMWQALVLSKNFESPKKLSDILTKRCYVDKFNEARGAKDQLIQFDNNVLQEDTLFNEFVNWISEWKFSDANGKLKIKNLFMHLFLKYDLDPNEKKLILLKNITRTYAPDAITQDLDHMDARNIKKSEEKRYFSYNLVNRTSYTNSLGNMMPLPIAINRKKRNTTMEDTFTCYSDEKLNYWLFTSAKKLFDNNKELVENYYVPKKEFFDKRKEQLIDYFKRIVRNQKFTPDQEV